MPQLASAGGELVDPRGEQLMAFRIAERAHGAFQTPAVSEVMFHGGLFLLVRVPPVPFPASGLSSGAFLLEAFPVPHRQHPPAGIAEFVYHVRGAALVSDVQVHGPVTLLLAVLRHKGGGLLPARKSKKTSPPRMRHILAKEKHAFRLFLCVDNCCYLIMRNIGNASLNRLDFVGKSLLVFVRQLLTVFGSKNHSE